ncbi:hypothetical protein QO002_001167 [Pararhizobium capsulatum DSM 1112]|uniref:DUF7674 domain-containing protein n=1 Tax=Pararhizobium capsulatum DSM 1112 TaxID=1121113 RepID=A0ABU0BMS0_9HYPH|nr:hypothetical protein [Pararhizobium capsulatum]MDQ0319029.1 hypothetical protein [Pararhizobium capsulatum DSM 1112]
MTAPLSISEMFAPLWRIVPDFREKSVALSFAGIETHQTLPYAVLGELASYLIDRLKNGDTDGFEEIFELVEKWHIHGDEEARTAATIGLLEDLQNPALHDQTVPEQFRKWLLPETAIWWQRVEDFWSAAAVRN